MSVVQAVELFWLMGLPGSGKSTQMQILMWFMKNLWHQEMSKLLNGGAKSGRLCKNDLVRERREEFIKKHIRPGGRWALDGFIRSELQVHECLQNMRKLRSEGMFLRPVFLEFEVSDETADKRMLERAMEPGSGRENELSPDVRRQRIIDYRTQQPLIRSVLQGVGNVHIIPEASVDEVNTYVIEALRIEGIVVPENIVA